jgi:hypothetical protein
LFAFYNCRNTYSKVCPAMYIENVSDLAFDDVTTEDPDFPFIQGQTQKYFSGQINIFTTVYHVYPSRVNH